MPWMENKSCTSQKRSFSVKLIGRVRLSHFVTRFYIHPRWLDRWISSIRSSKFLDAKIRPSKACGFSLHFDFLRYALPSRAVTKKKTCGNFMQLQNQWIVCPHSFKLDWVLFFFSKFGYSSYTSWCFSSVIIVCQRIPPAKVGEISSKFSQFWAAHEKSLEFWDEKKKLGVILRKIPWCPGGYTTKMPPFFITCRLMEIFFKAVRHVHPRSLERWPDLTYLSLALTGQQVAACWVKHWRSWVRRMCCPGGRWKKMNDIRKSSRYRQ